MFGCSLRLPDPTCQHLPTQPYWQELVVGAIAFGLVCLVLMRVVFPRMERTFQARHDAIDGGLARAEATRLEAATVLADYHDQLARAHADAASIRATATADAMAERERMLTEARTEAERIVTAGRRSLRADEDAVRAQLAAPVEALAAELAARVIGEPAGEMATRR